ncbi:E3 ISG15--protein ligase herc5 [Gamsiella multidivaricata]|nr:E3 ISG15--protein ligase herc5 [Gamsiella multidivaricata]
MGARSQLIQTRPFLSWLFNPKEDPITPKKLSPLVLDESGQRLIFWDSTYTTPLVKPEFSGNEPKSQVGLTTESFHDDDSDDITDVHFVNQLANEVIVQVASGSFHNLALSKTGKLWSWGSGCLGRGDEVYDSLPQPVEFFHALGRDIKQIFAAGNYSMALARPKDGNDDELYIWGYIPFGEKNEDGEVIPVMRKSLRPLLVSSVLGYDISHVACSPWHFTVAATPVSKSSSSTSSANDVEREQPLLMTFGTYSEAMPLEKPYSPFYADIPPEDEFYYVEPWRTFHPVPSTSDLVIKKMAASKGCDILLMENGSIGVSDHEDHVARLIHHPLDVSIVDVAGGSSEVIAVSSEGQVLSWSEPSSSTASPDDGSSSNPRTTTTTTTTTTTASKMADDSLRARFNLKHMSPSALHPLLGLTKDEKRAETEVLEFFDSQLRTQEQKKPVRLVEALFESSRLIVQKPGLSKCVAEYDRFTVC